MLERLRSGEAPQAIKGRLLPAERMAYQTGVLA